jgi:hypothetical protein
MTKDNVHDVLTRVIGHLTTVGLREDKELQKLHQSLSRSLLSEDVQQLKGSDFQFENADLLSAANVSPELESALRGVTQQTTSGKVPQYRTFVREVAVRSVNLPASLAPWALGAAIDHTIGPFTNRDGRQFWFDFFKIERLVALYIQGKTEPALLFNVSVGLQSLSAKLPPVAEPATVYKLSAGSIWINSQLLAQNASAGLFTGLLIKGGTIKLSAAPQVISGKLTIAPSVTAIVQLNLQQAVPSSDPASPYGLDARAATLQLPGQFGFRFTGTTQSIDAVSASDWNVYGDAAHFEWQKLANVTYNVVLRRVLIPLKCSSTAFTVRNSQSPFYAFSGSAAVVASAWALPTTQIDVLHPTPAAGIGGLMMACAEGLISSWSGLEGGDMSLRTPLITVEPGHIAITDLSAGNLYCKQNFRLWQDKRNLFGTDIKVQYLEKFGLFWNTVASGEEVLAAVVNADVQIDRPVSVSGQVFPVRTKNSLLIVSATKATRAIYFFDDNILANNSDLSKQPPVLPQAAALAMHNALFKVTPVNGCAVFGSLAEDFIQITQGFLFLTFGVYAYLPTLPDPYAANLAGLQFQFRESRLESTFGARVWMLLVCQIQWKPEEDGADRVQFSFHFAPLQQQFQTELSSGSQSAGPPQAQTAMFPNPTDQPPVAVQQTPKPSEFSLEMSIQQLPDYNQIWSGSVGSPFEQESFALLDVSTNADLLGVSFGAYSGRQLGALTREQFADGNAQISGFPLQVRGMFVESQARNVRFFTVPQISWEPVLNLTPPSPVSPGDPSIGPNYYPDDGGPTRILNDSTHQVALAPIPLTHFLVEKYKHDTSFTALALFTLPFGIKALALLQKQYESDNPTRRGADVLYEPKKFLEGVKGAMQLRLNAGAPYIDVESDTFMGSTIQINNVLELDGSAKGNSTLGAVVTEVFNNEFLLAPFNPIRQRGVPLTRIDLSGYGASTFSNWLNPNASIAQTSQARFDVFVGRCAHEVIQIKSILYPWGIHVVRTITLFRTSTAYAYRWDSGWRAQSAGKFDFTYYVGVKGKSERREGKYEIHPGVVHALWNVQEIKEATNVLPFDGTMSIPNGDFYVDENGDEQQNTGGPMPFAFQLQPVYFNADVEVENPISGFKVSTLEGQDKKVCASKGILGFVQIAPRGMPLTITALRDLVARQGTIGGSIDCVLDINASGQDLRARLFDFSNSFGSDGTSPVFAVAARGTTVLPKDGAWTLVQHQNGTGNVTPVSDTLSVPLIRIGRLVQQPAGPVIDPAPATQLLRIAETAELLRAPVSSTINYGFLHTTDTQKALFLTPSYAPSLQKLLSKTPPLFADAFRIVNSKAIFPNAGNAVSTFGDAINLAKNGTEFTTNALKDAGTSVLEVMQINQLDGAGLIQQGYKMLKNVSTFDLPSTAWNLIDLGGAFKIYIEYKADNVIRPNKAPENLGGSLDYNIDSFAANVADTWKSRMQNVGLVIDLGPIKRLMTIKGSWDSNKGSEAQYGGSDSDPDFPSPQIEFAPELKPIIQILQILQDLQTANYKDAFQQGVRLAMSNKAGSWEYKLEASKEIPVVRFPPGFEYDDPNAPLKLEAGLKLGAYFNAALMVTTDPKQLLPTAGASLGFYGRLSVMCVSLSVATVYAVGQANLDIGADTAGGPSLHMKFGFGAQIVVGLPVVGSVSVLYMVGAEIFLDKTLLQISAFLLFQGRADLAAGMVCITITIEAKGTITRDDAAKRTDLAAQVTFAIDISLFLVIDIDFSTSWQEQRQIA